MNWQALWKPRWERSLREVLVFPLIILIMLVPLGLFTGGYTSLLHSSLRPQICSVHPCPITNILYRSLCMSLRLMHAMRFTLSLYHLCLCWEH